MARTLLMLAICVLPALVSATRPMADPLLVEGRVYCDTCCAGYETSVTTPIPGAVVRVECKDRKTQKLLYSIYGKTSSKGNYVIKVKEDHGDQFCDVVLISSPQKNCASADLGRERSRVMLTRNNGMASYKRFANALGFKRDKPLAGCKQLLKQYEQESED